MASPASSRRLALAALAAVAALAGWWLAGRAPAPSSKPAAAEPSALLERARDLAGRLPIVDTHIDLPYRLTEQGAPHDDVSRRTAKGDFDAERARAGGLDVAWMSIYVPTSYQESGGARAFADSLIDLVEGIVLAHPETFALVRTANEAEGAALVGRIALPMGIENGAAIEADLANVRHFFDRGVRYVTLTHGTDNLIGDSSYSPPGERTWKGLSPFGREVVAEMNRLGILVDLSHVSDETFDAAIAIVRAPPIASHSSCRAFTPGFERNLDDDRIRALADKGGVIQINFGSGFLTAAANAWSLKEFFAEREFRAASGAAEGSPELDAWRAAYVEKDPFPRATLADAVAHIDHVVAIAGIDHVGIGSDFDGVGPTLPTGLEDVSTYPNLIAALLEKGYSDEEVAKILGGNLLRVWREAERVARELQVAEAG